MKKLLFLFLALTFSIASFSQLKPKQLIGSWKYAVETDTETYTGKLVFSLQNDDLKVKSISNEGYESEMVNAEIRAENTVYFEMNSDNGLIRVTLKIDKNSYKGTTELNGDEFPVTGKKIIEP